MPNDNDRMWVNNVVNQLHQELGHYPTQQLGNYPSQPLLLESDVVPDDEEDRPDAS